MDLLLLTALTFKHFIADFPLQSFPYMYMNKGKYLHPGGFLHVTVHMILTAIVLLLFGVPTNLLIGLTFFEGFIHYHMDWFKMWFEAKYTNWTNRTEEGALIIQADAWFNMLGFDQMIHALTYIAMVFLLGV